jgi:hypothetical protein
VPINETMDHIRERLNNVMDFDTWTILTIDDVMDLLKICLSSTYFKFNDNYYKQKEGCAMGSPISPIVAELYLQKLEMDLVKNNRDILFWRRYVDDTFAIVRTRKKTFIMNRLNSYHPSIQFTIEEEKDGKLPFLDIMFYDKPDHSLGHHIHRKDTHTNHYLNYKSYHPQAHKYGVMDTLFTRAFRISDDDHLLNELKFTSQVLQENGYPKRVIEQRMKKVEYKIKNNIKRPQNNDKRIILPYAGNVTSKIARYLQRNLPVQIGYFPGPKLGPMVCNAKTKHKKPLCGVYSIQCQECPAKYIGETERDYTVRIKEHENAIRSNNVQISPVALHMINEDHHLDTTSYKLIHREPRKFYRKFKEALHIKNTTNKMNISKGVPINSIWSSQLLSFLKY